MPDWTYQTVFRPLLFGLGPLPGQRLAFGFMGTLARLPWGNRVIQLMGHMRPDPRLGMEKHLSVPSRVGLGCALDPHLSATPAFAEFGLGFVEIGPIAANPRADVGPISMDVANESLRCESPQSALTPIVAAERLERDGPFHIPILARILPVSEEEFLEMVTLLGEQVEGFIIPAEYLESLSLNIEPINGDKSLKILAAADSPSWNDATVRERIQRLVQSGALCGVAVVPQNEKGSQTFGKPGSMRARETVRDVRQALGSDSLVIGSVGVHSPADALNYFEAGADWVQVDSGLVFAGPGLPKRINDAVLYRRLASEPQMPKPPERLGSESWFWAFLMGLAMFIGGLMAMMIATTRVVMPYDESMAGLTRGQLAELNDRLLSFMTHDRVTLAGTMLAVGILYLVFAWWGIRRGLHWAYLSVVVSAFTGFVSFFSFMGFGYFDPFHAFVTAVMFQFLLMTIHAHLPARQLFEPPDLWNDGRWKANQWGQLLFVIHGAVLITAGLVISSVGMTTVFVHEDLEFMHTSAEELFGAHPQLVPLVAHDRATFGGMLIACGVGTFLPALWGFRRGQAWLWFGLIVAGHIAYVSTILVHWTVGYDSLMHLLPAYGGLVGLWLGGLASYRYLVARDEKLESEWRKRLAAPWPGSE